MNWIHCNICFRQPSKEKRITFYMSNCGHFVCQLCKLKDSEKKCSVCKNSCVLLRLSNDLPPDVVDFFSEPMKSLDHIIKIMGFQTSHKDKLLDHYSGLTEKYNRLKIEYQKLQLINTSVMNENKTLKTMIMNSQKKSPAFFFNSPAMSNKSPQDTSFILSPANSMVSIRSGMMQSQPKPDVLPTPKMGHGIQSMSNMNSYRNVQGYSASQQTSPASVKSSGNISGLKSPTLSRTSNYSSYNPLSILTRLAIARRS